MICFTVYTPFGISEKNKPNYCSILRDMERIFFYQGDFVNWHNSINTTETIGTKQIVF